MPLEKETDENSENEQNDIPLSAINKTKHKGSKMLCRDEVNCNRVIILCKQITYFNCENKNITK